MTHIEIKVPELPALEKDAYLVRWQKKIGDLVSKDCAVADIELSKVVLEVVAPGAGFLRSILVSENTLVRPHQLLAVLDTEGVTPVMLPTPTELQHRQEKYCCVRMFAAVTDGRERVRFIYSVFRGEPCWGINNDLSFFSYCPWCGTALPDRPFE